MAEMIWWCEVTELPYRCSYKIGTSSAVAHDACGSRILSAPGELVDPADLDYEAAMRPLDKFLHGPWFPHERYEECPDIEGELVALIVRAALGVGESAEGSE